MYFDTKLAEFLKIVKNIAKKHHFNLRILNKSSKNKFKVDHRLSRHLDFKKLRLPHTQGG